MRKMRVRARGRSEVGMRNAECGMRRTEFGVLSTRY